MRFKSLLIVLIFSLITSSLLANDYIAPEDFTKDITLVSLNPTWSCGPCRANDYSLKSLAENLESDYSIETISLSLSEDVLKDVFFITGVPTTLIYKGDELIEVVNGLHSDKDYARFVGVSLENYTERRDRKTQQKLDQFKQSFRQYLNQVLEQQAIEKERENGPANQIVRTCVSYETKRVQTGGLLQWSKVRGRCLSYDERELGPNEEIIKTCSEYEYKRVQTGGLLQWGKVKAFCKRYDVDTVLK